MYFGDFGLAGDRDSVGFVRSSEDKFADGVFERFEDILEDVFEVGVVGPDGLLAEEAGGVGGGDKLVF